MNSHLLILCVALVLVVAQVHSQEKPKEYKVGEPQFSLQAAGGGNNAKNFQAGFQAGLGSKVWESKDKKQSLDVGATYGQGFARQDGHTFKSNPNYGLGMTYRWGRK